MGGSPHFAGVPIHFGGFPFIWRGCTHWGGSSHFGESPSFGGVPIPLGVSPSLWGFSLHLGLPLDLGVSPSPLGVPPSFGGSPFHLGMSPTLWGLLPSFGGCCPPTLPHSDPYFPLPPKAAARTKNWTPWTPVPTRMPPGTSWHRGMGLGGTRKLLRFQPPGPGCSKQHCQGWGIPNLLHSTHSSVPMGMKFLRSNLNVPCSMCRGSSP